MPDSSIVMSWFTEGFTAYYQDLMLLRAGLIPFSEYLKHLNETLRSYRFSPARKVPNREVIERRVDRPSESFLINDVRSRRCGWTSRSVK